MTETTLPGLIGIDRINLVPTSKAISTPIVNLYYSDEHLVEKAERKNACSQLEQMEKKGLQLIIYNVTHDRCTVKIGLAPDNWIKIGEVQYFNKEVQKFDIYNSMRVEVSISPLPGRNTAQNGCAYLKDILYCRKD